MWNHLWLIHADATEHACVPNPETKINASQIPNWQSMRKLQCVGFMDIIRVMSQDLSYFPNRHSPHISRLIRSHVPNLHLAIVSWPPKAGRQCLPRRPRHGNLNVGLSTIGPVQKGTRQWSMRPNDHVLFLFRFACCLLVLLVWMGRLSLLQPEGVWSGIMTAQIEGLTEEFHWKIQKAKSNFLQLCPLPTQTLVI